MMRGGTLWKPNDRWSKFEDLPDGPKPAATSQARTVQFREIAKRFSVSDMHGWTEPEITRHQLRLQTQPLHRYSNDKEIIDGAVFGFVLGTDPEAFLLVELYKSGEQRQWRYAVFQMTIYELEAKLDDKVVWQKPRALRFGEFSLPHYVTPYKPDPGEPELQGLMPSAE